MVTTKDISLPLIGYNVIKLCVKSGMTSPELACVFPSLSCDIVNSLFDIIDTHDDSDFCAVRTNKKQCVNKRGRCSQIAVGLIMDQLHLRFQLFSNLRKIQICLMALSFQSLCSR